MNKTLPVTHCSRLPVLTCEHCYTLAFENAKTLYWLSECKLVPYGLLGKISSSSRKTNHKCAAYSAQATRREYVTSACAILLPYFIIWFWFFLSCSGSYNYYHSFVNYNNQYHTVRMLSFVLADRLTLSIYFLITLIKLNKLKSVSRHIHANMIKRTSHVNMLFQSKFNNWKKHFKQLFKSRIAVAYFGSIIAVVVNVWHSL